MKSKANGLMGDLESIKALLGEEEPGQAVPEDDSIADEIGPLPEALPGANAPEPQIPLLSDALQANAPLTTLLGKEFHDATQAVLAAAREEIDAHPTQWSPQQTDELADALRVRIDGAVQQWIAASLAAHAGELQQRLLTAVRDELDQHLDTLRHKR